MYCNSVISCSQLQRTKILQFYSTKSQLSKNRVRPLLRSTFQLYSLLGEPNVVSTRRGSTAVEKVVACAPVAQRARVRSPVRTSFLGEVFSGLFLTCKTNVRKF